MIFLRSGEKVRERKGKRCVLEVLVTLGPTEAKGLGVVTNEHGSVSLPPIEKKVSNSLPLSLSGHEWERSRTG